MSNKIAILLSMIIFLQAFLLCLDLINVQLITTRLTIESNYINTLIAKHKEINDEVYEYVEKIINGELVCLQNCYPQTGDQLKYTISIKYQAMFQSAQKKISITRSVLIGN